MLIVSEELARRSILDSSLEVRQAQQNLWRAQTNDVYWHGVFGGLYLPHLRADAYGAAPCRAPARRAAGGLRRAARLRRRRPRRVPLPRQRRRGLRPPPWWLDRGVGHL